MISDGNRGYCPRRKFSEGAKGMSGTRFNNCAKIVQPHLACSSYMRFQRLSDMILRFHVIKSLIATSFLAVALSCGDKPAGKTGKTLSPNASVHSLNFAAADSIDSPEQNVNLYAAQNEWVSFSVKVSSDIASSGKAVPRLRVTELSSPAGAIAPANFSAFQLLPMPLDLNRAGYVRHTGLPVSNR